MGCELNWYQVILFVGSILLLNFDFFIQSLWCPIVTTNNLNRRVNFVCLHWRHTLSSINLSLIIPDIYRYVPELKNIPTEYIYSPWEASKDVQEKAGCIIGRDYPEPMVDHDTVVRTNKEVSQWVVFWALNSNNR